MPPDSTLGSGIVKNTLSDDSRTQSESSPKNAHHTKESITPKWEDDPSNALNWPSARKVHLVVFLACYGFLA